MSSLSIKYNIVTNMVYVYWNNNSGQNIKICFILFVHFSVHMFKKKKICTLYKLLRNCYIDF